MSTTGCNQIQTKDSDFILPSLTIFNSLPSNCIIVDSPGLTIFPPSNNTS